VYLARDPFGGRDVAIKVFLFDRDADPQDERMKHKAFVAEAALAGRLNHPHIVEIYDAVVEPDHSYLVMEYVPGATLEAHARVSSLLPLHKVVEIVFKSIRALEYAFHPRHHPPRHQAGNILLSDKGETKVSDFGASFQHRPGHTTTQVAGVGSPAYMSPEQVRMEPLTQQTDIYSLGVTMYRLLTGRLPYYATTQAAMAHAILYKDPARAGDPAPGAPRGARPHRAQGDGQEARPSATPRGSSSARSSPRPSPRCASSAPPSPTRRSSASCATWRSSRTSATSRCGKWCASPPGAPSAGHRHHPRGRRERGLLPPRQGRGRRDPRGERARQDPARRLLRRDGLLRPRGARRTTTVTARSKVTMVEIRASALRNATDACQNAFNKAVARVLIERLAQTNKLLALRTVRR
jgi:serine/threonine protein kinase